MKKCLIIAFLFLSIQAFGVNVVVECTENIKQNEENADFSARVLEKAEFKSGLTLKENDEIQGIILKSVEARRGKRSAYFIMRPEYIYRNSSPIDFNENLEAKVVGYSKTDWKKSGVKAGLDAGLTVTSHYIPGFSQMFYFSKGLLQPYEDKSRVMSGVQSVYENSPFAYIEKGKDLNIEKGDYLILKFYYSDVPAWQYFKRTK